MSSRDELRGRPGPAGPPRTPLRRSSELDAQQAALHAEILAGPRKAQALVPLTDREGRLLGPFGLMLLSPRLGSAVQALGAALRIDDDLPPRSRELAILVVASTRESEFEWNAHEQAARQAGLDTAQLQQLLDGVVPAGLEPDDACLVRTVRTLLATGALDDTGYADAVSRLGVARLAALVWLVGYYAMLATALATFRPAGGTQSGSRG